MLFELVILMKGARIVSPPGDAIALHLFSQKIQKLTLNVMVPVAMGL